MLRLSEVVLIAVVSSVVVSTGCKKRAPDVPSTPAGPTGGTVNSECTFTSSAQDPEDSVAIRFDWGDGDTSDWSSYVPSGEAVAASHSWADSGSYSVRAQAKDAGDAPSDWSAGHQLAIVAFEPLLLLDPPSVKIVPNGTEVVVVAATDEGNLPLAYSVECDDATIATVTKTDSGITITGLDYGTTNVKVSCGAGLARTFPVQVYDPKVFETGELTIAFVDTFESRWWSGGIPTNNGAFWHPVPPAWFHALGSLGFQGYVDPNGKRTIMVVKAKPGSNVLAPPDSYRLVWDSHGTRAADGSFWIPIPPPGYKALGLVAQRGFSEPSLNDVVCVREDLTVEGATGGEIFHDSGSIFIAKLIEPPVAGPHDSCYLAAGTFVGKVEPDYPRVYVLKVMLPMMAEAADQTFAPKLTGFDEPPDQTAPLTCKEMSVPWSIVKDASYDSIWRMGNSPNYRLERQVFYRCLYHNYNQTSELQINSVTLTSGTTTERSKQYTEDLGVSISCEVGVSYGIASGSVSATVSKSFGYTTQTSVIELEEKVVYNEVATAPGKAAALWQKFNRFTLKRHNGTNLEPVGTWEIGIDSYVTDEYPND